MCPVLTYGAGCWVPTKADLERIYQAHKGMCGRILNMKLAPGESWVEFLLRRSQRVKAIWQTMNIKSWDRVVLQRLHQWAGHIARYEHRNSDHLAHICSRWRDSQYISFRKAMSYDGRRLFRGHRRRPWRWEHSLFVCYNRSHSGDYPAWRRLAQTSDKWAISQDRFVAWRLSNASNLNT